MRGFLILIPAIIGLCAICRTGKWRWKVIESGLLNTLFGIGWFTSLIVGMIEIISSIRRSLG